ncbi:uncharacterized protein DS421_7g216380 [Arachis hypogaea]|nr:uncharacterized protein DS421_7g216380 [Arachis hypogaea]
METRKRGRKEGEREGREDGTGGYHCRRAVVLHPEERGHRRARAKERERVAPIMSLLSEEPSSLPATIIAVQTAGLLHARSFSFRCRRAELGERTPLREETL